ncbi:hypothetical protein [Roseimaritima ulvae]|nr:hypothetical protein [Roseimaritima ulvae]
MKEKQPYSVAFNPTREEETIRMVHATRPIDGTDNIELAMVDGWKCFA